MPICIHCRNEMARLTKDHVFAGAWYRGTTPRDLKQVDRNRPAAEGTVQTALRSISPETGRNPWDSRLRLRKREKLFRHMRILDEMPREGGLPSDQRNWEDGSRISFRVPADEPEPQREGGFLAQHCL